MRLKPAQHVLPVTKSKPTDAGPKVTKQFQKSQRGNMPVSKGKNDESSVRRFPGIIAKKKKYDT